jgi:hypothetical protein
MKIIPTLAVIASFIALGVGQSKAQTTNVVLQVNVALTGFSSSNGPVHITTKDLIQAFGAASSTNFPANSKLVVINDISHTNGGPVFFVRSKSGTNVTDTPLGSFITVSQNTDEIDVSGTKYSDLEFDVNNGDTSSFFVNGFTTRKTGFVSGGRGVGKLSDKQTTSVTISNGAGGGTWNGNTVVLKGNITASSPKVEVVASGT